MDSYVVERWEVFVNTWGEGSHLRPPTPEERAILDRYFASPGARNPDGSVRGLFGEEVAGIEGDVITYPVGEPG